jgi:hypothetical protein
VAKAWKLGQRVVGAMGLTGGALDPLRSWTATREFPVMAKQSFREWWEEEKVRRVKSEEGSNEPKQAPMKKTTLKINVPAEAAAGTTDEAPKVKWNKTMLKIKVPTEKAENIQKPEDRSQSENQE